MGHMFFKTQHLDLERKRQLCLWARERCYVWWVDILDCSKSWARQKINMSFEEILGKLTDRCHFTVIHRNGEPEDFLEIAFSTIGPEPDYFLWLLLKPEHIPAALKMLEQSPGDDSCQ